MRITNNMMVSQLMYNLTKNLNTMSTSQDQLATGKRVIRASDDPIDASKILKYKSDISEYKQFSTNTRDAKGWLQVTESAIADTNQVILRLKELSVQASTGTNSITETKNIKAEVEQLKGQIITNANVNFAGRYLFSGFQTDKPFFKKDGTLNVDVTNNEVNNAPKTKLQIGVGEDLEISTNGIDLFGVVTTTTSYNTVLQDAVSTNGIAEKKSEFSGAFDLSHDYTGENLDINFGGNTYVVNEATLDGSLTKLDKAAVISALENADDGGTPLSSVADIYFDGNDKLVIRAKSAGATTISMGASGGYSPTLSIGNTTTEASINFSGQTFDDAFVAANSADLVATPIYITYNGERKAVKLDPSLTLTTAAGFSTAVQNAIDKEFGAGNVAVSLGAPSPAAYLQFNTIGTTGNIKPSLGVELVVAKESELLRDIDDLIVALDTNDKAGIDNFLTLLTPHHNRLLEGQAEIGAKENRIDLVDNRITDNITSFTKMLSDAQDADISKVIMDLKNAENVYKSALSTGARVIQPTLMDFIR